MITVEALRDNYIPVTERKFSHKLPPGTKVQLADLHTHPHVDSRVGVIPFLTNAHIKGVDWLAMTDHDEGGDEETTNAIRRIRDLLGFEINIISASEATALPIADPYNRKGKHVIILNQKKLLQPFMSWKDLRQKANEEEMLLFPAHLELGRGKGNISYTGEEVKRMVDAGLAPDGLEVHNGSGVLFDRYAWAIDPIHNSLLVPQAFKDFIPPTGSNAAALTIYNEYSDEIPAASAGSDDHEGTRVAEAVVVIPEGADLFEAMRAGETEVHEQKKLARLQPISMIDSVLLAQRHIKKPPIEILSLGKIDKRTTIIDIFPGS
ncbi:MAG: hypothetical protein H0W89_01475 [Candidatus Levybacteria bacterium]|nr:hypothetical protein [Candidatus Levybacteria bacterium]